MLHIFVWASALLSFDWLGMRDALESGTSNRYSDPHFFVYMYQTKIKKTSLNPRSPETIAFEGE